MSTNKPSAFNSFAEFYPYYLSEHGHPVTRRLHFVGTTLVIAVAIWIAMSGQLWGLVLLPVAGYGFAWVGHFFFEKNRPATFQYPLYSLAGDFVMFKDILTSRIDW